MCWFSFDSILSFVKSTQKAHRWTVFFENSHTNYIENTFFVDSPVSI